MTGRTAWPLVVLIILVWLRPSIAAAMDCSNRFGRVFAVDAESSPLWSLGVDDCGATLRVVLCVLEGNDSNGLPIYAGCDTLMVERQHDGETFYGLSVFHDECLQGGVAQDDVFAIAVAAEPGVHVPARRAWRIAATEPWFREITPEAIECVAPFPRCGGRTFPLEPESAN